MSYGFENLQQRIRQLQQAKERGEVRYRDVQDGVWSDYRAARGCPTDEDFAAYTDGTLKLRRRLGTWWHIRTCALCQMELLALRDALTGEAREPQLYRRRAAWFPRWLPRLALVAILIAGSLIGYQLIWLAPARVLERAQRAAGQNRAAIEEAIVIARKNLQAIQGRGAPGRMEAIQADAWRIRADAEELARGKERWEKAASDLKKISEAAGVEWYSSSVAKSLEATQTAMNELAHALEQYAEIELLLKRAERAFQVQDFGVDDSAKALEPTSKQLLVSLNKVEAMLAEAKK